MLTPPTLWRPTRADWRAMGIIGALVALLALPQLFGFRADPLFYVADVAIDSKGSAWLAGVPYVDPNNGFQTQALGYRAMLEWLQGRVPWWNPYSGIGMPLAAEYQPAAFFPLTVLLLLPRGPVLLQSALELLAGLGTFALLRQLGVGRTAALAGGIAFGFNGTLAWIAHGPAGVVPSLPWILLGIERAWQSALARGHAGWRLLAIGMAMSLLAGFPETAYYNGLLALAWFGLRIVQSPSAARTAFMARVIGGAAVAIMVAAPQVVSFLLYLPDAYLAGHVGVFEHAVIPRTSILAVLFAPYSLGPPFAYHGQWELLYWHWTSVAGYVSIAILALAAFGVAGRRDGLAMLLGAWSITAIGKSFGLEPFTWLWNLVPGVAIAPFARYGTPSYELALILLAAFAIDAVDRSAPQSRGRWLALAAACAGVAGAFAYAARFWNEISPHDGLVTSMLLSFAWACATVFVIAPVAFAARGQRAAATLAFVVAVDAVVLFAVPIASNPRTGRIDTALIGFLQQNLGFQRFFTLGRIQPNYGAYFGIASVNHNYLPVPQRWVDYVLARLDGKLSEAVVFDGLRDDGAMLRANMDAYREAGVRYVVTNLDHDPFIAYPGVKRVFRDGFARVFEIEGAKPYFEVIGAKCGLEAHERTQVTATCDSPGLLVRRELFFPGWTATVNGRNAAIAEQAPVFQSVALPGGRSQVRFEYSPPHIAWAWTAMWLGLAALAAPSLLLRRKHQ